jgi:hypothetical protein
MPPKIKKEYKSTYHRDGTISYWSTYQQRWIRCFGAGIPDEDYLAMSPLERERVIRHIDRSSV